jgi:serine/threonine protein kinase
VSRVVRILRDVALALDEAHTIGLVHRDVKPSNIMLARKGGVHDVVKVLDFGLVKSTREAKDPSETDTRLIRGTPHYMSPEAIENPGSVDARSDLYALGAVGYYLLAGRPVFEADSFFEIYAKHVQEAPKPLSEVCENPIPAGLEQLILACLAKAKADRPKSAQALADALDQLDVPPWTRADAERWWKQYGDLVERERESMVPRITGHTMDVVIDEPWFESSDG